MSGTIHRICGEKMASWPLGPSGNQRERRTKSFEPLHDIDLGFCQQGLNFGGGLALKWSRVPRIGAQFGECAVEDAHGSRHITFTIARTESAAGFKEGWHVHVEG